MSLQEEPENFSIDLIKSFIRKKDTTSLDKFKLQLKSNFYYQDERGNTFLHYIAKKNSLQMVKYFLEFEKRELGDSQTPCINIQNSDGHLPRGLLQGRKST